MEKPLIYYLITSFDAGVGGSFHDLSHLFTLMKTEYRIRVLNFGPSPSLVLKDGIPNIYYSYIPVTQAGIKSALDVFCELTDAEKPAAFHSFDLASLYFAKRMGFKKAIPVIHTKTGGPNPLFYPQACALIVNSEENYKYFLKKRKVSSNHLYLVPSRVCRILLNKSTTPARADIHKNEKQIVLRICRIGTYHKESILQSLELVKQLNARGIASCLHLVGLVENKRVYEQIKKEADGLITFFTEERDYRHAASFIPSAAIVLATGRGCMEALAMDKIVCVPDFESGVPILLTGISLEELAINNFSGRSTIAAEGWDGLCEQILQLRQGEQLSEEYIHFAREAFEKYGALEPYKEKYLTIYKALIEQKATSRPGLALYLYTKALFLKGGYRN